MGKIPINEMKAVKGDACENKISTTEDTSQWAGSKDVKECQ